MPPPTTLPNPPQMIWLRHRDPQRLWVKIALISVLVHGLLLWLGLPIFMRTQSAVTASEEAVVVPIELLDSPISAQSAGVENLGANAIASELAPNAQVQSTPAQSTSSQSDQPNSGATAPFANGTPISNTTPTNGGDAAPSNVEQANSQVNSGTPTVNSGNIGGPNRNTPQGTPRNPPAPTGTNTSNGSGTDSRIPSNSGQDGGSSATADGLPESGSPAVLVQLSPGVTPTNEADIPQQLPTLIDPRPRRLDLTPGTAICTVTNPAIVTQYSQSGLTASLRLTVEANGQVSNVSVYQTSENSTFDEFARCLVQQQGLRFNPARDGGQAVPTTLMILDVSLSPG